MYSDYCMKESLNPKYLLRLFKFNQLFKKDNPDYFYPDGLICFFGPQGSGKTLSAVNYVYKLMESYPKCKLVTNLQLRDLPIILFDDYLLNRFDNDFNSVENIYNTSDLLNYYHELYLEENRVFPFNNGDDLKLYSNSKLGVIYLIDEIQLYFNSLQSKNVNPEVMTEISQQRKQRKHIVCTSQVFGRMAKPLRDQFSVAVQCKKYFNFLQVNAVLDRDSITDSADDMHIEGKVLKKYFWFHDPNMFDKYDTYYKIQTTKFVANEDKRGEIYGEFNTNFNADNPRK